MGLGGCEVLEPEPEPAPEPVPGFVVSVPVPTRSLQDVVVVTANDVGITSAFAVGTDGTILHFDGASWSREDVEGGLDEDLEGVSGVIDDDGFEHVMAVGAGGVVVRRTGASGVWERLDSPVTDYLFGVWVRRSDDAFIVGDRGRVMRWDGEVLAPLVDEVLIDSGAVDNDGVPIAFPISEPLKAVQGRGGDEVYVVGPRGAVYRFDGTAFLRELSGTNRPLADVFTGAGVWAATTDGVLLRRRGDGWRDDEFITPVPAFLQSVWARNDGDVFAVGLTAEVFHLVDGVWSVTTVGESVELRAIDGRELPPPEDADPEEEREILREVLAVGAGGRIVRGPLAVPRGDELVLSTVLAEDFSP
jgi:uncharacterized cupin superfamily protein